MIHKWVTLTLVVILLLFAGANERVMLYIKNQSIGWKVCAGVGLISALILITLQILGFPK